MFDPRTSLLSAFLAARVAELTPDGGPATAWADAAQALGPTREREPDLAAAIDAKDAGGLRAIVAAWAAGTRQLPVQDRELCKVAMAAFRKRLKLTRLDHESSIGGGPMSGGRTSGISGITPPRQYAPEVWAALARQQRLVDVGHGLYELPPG